MLHTVELVQGIYLDSEMRLNNNVQYLQRGYFSYIHPDGIALIHIYIN